MKVLVVGKHGSIVHWMEDMADGFADAGHETRVFSVIGSSWPDYLHLKLYRTLNRGAVGGVLAGKLVAAVRRFQPDVMFCVGGYWLEPDMLAAVRALPQRPVMIGWVGDRFEARHQAVDALYDRVYHTDTAFFDLARELGFTAPTGYLPLAVNPRLFPRKVLPRNDRMVFVANRTRHRETIVRAIQRPVALYGRSWKPMSGTPHEIHPERIPPQALAGLYASHRAVLNIRNEINVLNGLNQRSFEPYLCGTPVLNDDMADVPRCFEPGKEILVYRNADELNALYERLAQDSAFAQAVGEAGYRRVMAEHTYVQRVGRVMNDLVKEVQ